MKKIFSFTIILSCFTFNSLFAQLDLFACTDYTQGKVFIIEKGEITWQHDAPSSNDLWMLPNGNLLFNTGKGVMEITRQKDTVFNYQSENYIYACQRLKNGNTFIGECNSGRMLEVDKNGKIVNEVSILPEGVKDAGRGFMRNARMLDNGHFLVAHFAGKCVTEYDKTGKPCWSVPVSGGAHSVIRLPNGNTLVAVADSDKNARVIEFNPKGEIVWEFSNKDIDGDPLKFITGMQYIPKLGVVFTNWQGHGKNEGHPMVYCVDRNKNIIYTFGPHKQISTLSSIYVPQKRGKQVFH